MPDPKFAIGQRVLAEYWTEIDGCVHRPGVVVRPYLSGLPPLQAYEVTLDPGTVPDYGGTIDNLIDHKRMIDRPITFCATEAQLRPVEPDDA